MSQGKAEAPQARRARYGLTLGVFQRRHDGQARRHLHFQVGILPDFRPSHQVPSRVPRQQPRRRPHDDRHSPSDLKSPVALAVNIRRSVPHHDVCALDRIAGNVHRPSAQRARLRLRRPRPHFPTRQAANKHDRYPQLQYGHHNAGFSIWFRAYDLRGLLRDIPPAPPPCKPFFQIVFLDQLATGPLAWAWHVA
jgi:hypothetical protein